MHQGEWFSATAKESEPRVWELIEVNVLSTLSAGGTAGLHMIVRRCAAEAQILLSGDA
jgi:hypothetical protein